MEEGNASLDHLRASVHAMEDSPAYSPHNPKSWPGIPGKGGL